MDILETRKNDDKTTSIKISFAMKDSLKKFIPSAKWNAKDKTWTVGSRSGKKLATWIEQAREEFDIADIAAKKDAFDEKLKGMKALSGHTFDHKDILKEKYNAMFHDKKWMVSADIYEEAQAALDALNVERSKTIIYKDDMEHKGFIPDALEILEKIVNNFDEKGQYKYQDDYFYTKHLKYEDQEQALKVTSYVQKTIGEYYLFADENDNPGIFFPDECRDWLRILNIPKSLLLDFYEATFIDYSDIEEKHITEMISDNLYKTVDDDECSKELDDARHEPTFRIKSEKTGETYDVNHLVTLNKRKSSSRVHIWEASNIPVLKDEKYSTEISYWWNSSRTRTINIKEL